jgi:hypothetical protein
MEALFIYILASLIHLLTAVVWTPVLLISGFRRIVRMHLPNYVYCPIPRNLPFDVTPGAGLGSFALDTGPPD